MTAFILLLVIPAIIVENADSKVPTSVSLLSKEINAFSQRLYQQIRGTDDSLVFSPYSVHAALSMASLGARGQTQTEMMTHLGTEFISSPHTTYKDLDEQLHSAQDVTLEMANGMFLNPGISLKPSFVQSLIGDYGAKVDNFDLTNPVKKINDYVENNTNGIIKDLLSPGAVTGDTLSVLVNTIFFNGTWERQFSKFRTHTSDFHKSDGSVSQVDMMGMERPITVDIAHDDNRHVDMIDLQFKGLRFALRLVVPRDPSATHQLESDPAELHTFSTSNDNFQTKTNVDVSIPKFKIETKEQLKAPLQNLGFRKAFNPGQADFSGMSDVPAHIDQVVHKAMIDVTEHGTVAAAATGIMIFPVSMPIIQERFVADRPFFFFLKDQVVNTVLFQGKFMG